MSRSEPFRYPVDVHVTSDRAHAPTGPATIDRAAIRQVGDKRWYLVVRYPTGMRTHVIGDRITLVEE